MLIFLPFALVIAVSIAIVILYMTAMSARNSGWSRLAKHYRGSSQWPRHGLRFVTVSLDGVVLQRIVHLGFGEQALCLKPTLLFRAFHPPLSIPWSDLSLRQLEGRDPALHAAKVPDVELALEPSLVEAMVTYARDAGLSSVSSFPTSEHRS